MSDAANWRDINESLGLDTVSAIDKAVVDFFGDHGTDIRKEDFYLATEGVTYAVCRALIEHNGPRPGRVFRLIDCPVCGRDTAVTPTGKVRRHRHADESGRCGASGKEFPGGSQ